ncbi:MAG: glycosyltransferase family 2 protein [Candidatus Zixiibacteriota bacterium]
MTVKPEISAIIIVYNGMKFLPDCLNTLIADIGTISHEIIAVDNGSSDGSAELIATNYPDVLLIRNGTNVGFARAVNIGLQTASSQHLYVLNQDLRFKPGATPTLLAKMKGDVSLGMIGPKYVGFDGQLQHSARAFPTCKHVWYDALLLSRLFPSSREFGSWRMTWFDHESELEVDQPMGSVMLIPRGVIEKVGLLDDSFPIFFNDVDYCRRIRAAGYRLLYYPSAVVEHFVGGSTRTRPMRMKIESHRSMYRYLKKYARWYQYPTLWFTGLLLLIGLIPVLFRTGLVLFRRAT